MYEDIEQQSNWNTEITCNKVGERKNHFMLLIAVLWSARVVISSILNCTALPSPYKYSVGEGLKLWNMFLTVLVFAASGSINFVLHRRHVLFVLGYTYNWWMYWHCVHCGRSSHGRIGIIKVGCFWSSSVSTIVTNDITVVAVDQVLLLGAHRITLFLFTPWPIAVLSMLLPSVWPIHF